MTWSKRQSLSIHNGGFQPYPSTRRTHPWRKRRSTWVTSRVSGTRGARAPRLRAPTLPPPPSRRRDVLRQQRHFQTLLACPSIAAQIGEQDPTAVCRKTLDVPIGAFADRARRLSALMFCVARHPIVSRADFLHPSHPRSQQAQAATQTENLAYRARRRARVRIELRSPQHDDPRLSIIPAA